MKAGRLSSDASVVSGSSVLDLVVQWVASGTHHACHMWHAPASASRTYPALCQSMRSILWLSRICIAIKPQQRLWLQLLCVCGSVCVCVCCLYSLCHMQIAATAASRCPVKGLQLPSIYADFRRLRIVQRVFGVFYLASFGCFGFFVD